MIITEIIKINPFKVSTGALKAWCKNKGIQKHQLNGRETYDLTYAEILEFVDEKIENSYNDFVYDQDKYDFIKSQADNESLEGLADDAPISYNTAKLGFKVMTKGEMRRIKGVNEKSKAWLQLEQAKAKEIDNNIKMQQYVPAEIFQLFMQSWVNFFERQSQDIPKKVIMQHKIKRMKKI